MAKGVAGTKIHIKCKRPKYAKGDYEFAKFEDVFHWLTKIKCLSRAFPGSCLYRLAENGFTRDYTGQFGIEIDSSFHDRTLAKKVGYKTGLLKAKGLGEQLARERAAALNFAKELDRKISGLT